MRNMSKNILLCLICMCIAKIFGMKDVPVGDYLYFDDVRGKPYTVSNDERSWIINGQRTLLLGGSIHYPRFSPGQWKDVLTNVKNDGLNHAQVYVFWNYHEQFYNFNGTHVYDFSGRGNLTQFLQIAYEVGIFINLRIGPYVCAEWSFGGLPTWLLHVDGILFRDDNAPWEEYMGGFVKEIAKIAEPFLARNGGPIVMAQIENEYRGSQAYIDWCGSLVTELDLQISWVMCNGMSANNTINTCNGNDCYNSYIGNHAQRFPGQPLGWTENEGWFEYWGREYNENVTEWDDRSPQDMANTVAKWFGGGAAHHNYYMYFGGNHVKNWAGSAIANMYADGVNYHGNGLPHEPKRTHLNKLHYLLAKYQKLLLSNEIQYPHPIPLNSSTSLGLYYKSCDGNNQYGLFTYDTTTSLLKLTKFNDEYCVYATGNSDPVGFKKCDINDNSQMWDYAQNEFKSTKNSCLDVFGATGPNIDEWGCKNPSSSDAKNQKWNIDGNLIRSQLNTNMCLVASTTPGDLIGYKYNTSDGAIVFLLNLDSSQHTIKYESKSYTLNATSVTIIDETGNVLYDTSSVDAVGLPTELVHTNTGDVLKFESFTESIPYTTSNRPDTPIINASPKEQIRLTNDSYEYLTYITSITGQSWNNVELQFVGACADCYMVYIDNIFQGQSCNLAHSQCKQTYKIPITVSDGKHNLTVISSSLGIHNGIANQQPPSAQDMKGIIGDIKIVKTTNNSTVIDLTSNGWTHYMGSTGEQLMVGQNPNNVKWTTPFDNTKGFTWYKTTFPTPVNYTGVLEIDIGTSGMIRGHVWLNGIDMGHYNNVKTGGPQVQQYYFIPNDYLAINTDNVLLFLEEISNPNPNNVNIVITDVKVPST